MDIISQIRKTLFFKWKSLSTNNDLPVYFYVISHANTGWGVVVPEMLGVLKHAIHNRYCVYFIANPASNTETLKLFDIGRDLNIWARRLFLESSGIDRLSLLLAESVWNSDNLKQHCAANPIIRQNFLETLNFHWPFGDILRCLVHSTEFVHPTFNLARSTYANFENLTVGGMQARGNPIKLTTQNMQAAHKILGDDNSNRFVLAVREAPVHHGLDRNTNPEGLDQLLLTVRKFTSKIDLIGTSPGIALSAVLKKHCEALTIIDHTYSEYEAHALHSEDIPGIRRRHLIQSHLLSTTNIKLLPQNGITLIPLAADQLHGVYDTPNIFNPWAHSTLTIPRRYSFAPDLSPIQAFVVGLTTLRGKEWILDRNPSSPEATLSAVENLWHNQISGDPNMLFKKSIFNPKILPTIRKELFHATDIAKYYDLIDFGSHLIQDKAGKPVRYA